MFVIQRVLETDGKLDAPGPERGHHAASVLPPLRHLQHGGIGRHHRALPRHPADQPGPDGPLGPLVATLNYLSHDAEVSRSCCRSARTTTPPQGPAHGGADGERSPTTTRTAFMNGELSTVMSPRTVITWAQNAEIFRDVGYAFRLTFLNKLRRAGAPDGGRVLPALLRRGAARERRLDEPGLERLADRREAGARQLRPPFACASRARGAAARAVDARSDGRGEARGPTANAKAPPPSREADPSARPPDGARRPGAGPSRYWPCWRRFRNASGPDARRQDHHRAALGLHAPAGPAIWP